MRNLVTMMVGAALVAGTAVSANAQDVKTTTGFSIRAGFFNPTDKNVRTATTDSWFAAGVDYKLGTEYSLFGKPGNFALSVDYTAKDGTRILPTALTYRVQQDKVYLLGGIGATFVNPKGSSSDTYFGYQLGVGYDIATQGAVPVFVEVKYLGAEKNYYSGLGVYAGVRF